jgi:hypothetical protein
MNIYWTTFYKELTLLYYKCPIFSYHSSHSKILPKGSKLFSHTYCLHLCILNHFKTYTVPLEIRLPNLCTMPRVEHACFKSLSNNRLVTCTNHITTFTFIWTGNQLTKTSPPSSKQYPCRIKNTITREQTFVIAYWNFCLFLFNTTQISGV